MIRLPLLLLALAFILPHSKADAQQRTPGAALPSFRTERELARYLRAAAEPYVRPPLVPSSRCAVVPPTVTFGRMGASAPRSAVVTGHVMWNANRGLQGAIVTAALLEGSAITEEDGRFNITVPPHALAAGDSAALALMVHRRGYVPQEIARVLRPGDSLSVTVRMCSAAGPTGTEVMSYSPRPTFSEWLTTPQQDGVEEGGLVKRHGDHLVILRSGRLFTVAVGDGALRPVAEVDAFPPGTDGSGAWYRDILVHRDRVVVVGTSPVSRGTELNVFRIDRAGQLTYAATYHLRTHPEAPATNFATRLMDGRLVLYTATHLANSPADPLALLPAIRRWHGAGDSTARFERIVRPRDVHVALPTPDSALPAVLHSVTTCDFAAEPLDCSASVLVGPRGWTFHVSSTAVYLWTDRSTPKDAATAPAVVYRMPVDASPPGAVRANGLPADPFSMIEARGNLYVAVRPHGHEQHRDPKFNAERLALLRIPLRTFATGRTTMPRGSYRMLPLEEDADLRLRFTGSKLFYGPVHWFLMDTGSVTVVPLEGGRPTRFPLPHDVFAVLQTRTGALVTGASTDGLHLTTLDLARPPRASHSYVVGVRQDEGRAYQWFHGTDAAGKDIVAMPAYRAQHWFAHLGAAPAAVLFFQADRSELRNLGQLVSHDPVVDDGCTTTCEGFGDSRALFIDGRILALLGYELVEGEVRDGQIVEVNRVKYGRDRATVAQLEAGREARALRNVVVREARWRETGMADSLRALYSIRAVVIPPGGGEPWYGNFAAQPPPMPGGRGARFTPVVEDVRVDGNTAVMRIAWLIVTGSGDERQRMSVTEMRVWTREDDGRWMITQAVQTGGQPER